MIDVTPLTYKHHNASNHAGYLASSNYANSQCENLECNDWYACSSLLQFDSNTMLLQKLHQTSHSSHLKTVTTASSLSTSRFSIS